MNSNDKDFNIETFYVIIDNNIPTQISPEKLNDKSKYVIIRKIHYGSGFFYTAKKGKGYPKERAITFEQFKTAFDYLTQHTRENIMKNNSQTATLIKYLGLSEEAPANIVNVIANVPIEAAAATEAKVEAVASVAPVEAEASVVPVPEVGRKERMTKTRIEKKTARIEKKTAITNKAKANANKANANANKAKANPNVANANAKVNTNPNVAKANPNVNPNIAKAKANVNANANPNVANPLLHNIPPRPPVEYNALPQITSKTSNNDQLPATRKRTKPNLDTVVINDGNDVKDVNDVANPFKPNNTIVKTNTVVPVNKSTNHNAVESNVNINSIPTLPNSNPSNANLLTSNSSTSNPSTSTTVAPFRKVAWNGGRKTRKNKKSKRKHTRRH